MSYHVSTGVIVPFVKKYKEILIIVTAALFALSLVSLGLQTRATMAPSWMLETGSEISFSCGGGTYVHTVDSVVHGIGGNFTGTGHYNADSGYTWDIVGSIYGDEFDFSIVYTGTSAGSVYNATNGAVSAGGSAVADVDSNCQSLTMINGSFSPYSIPETEVDVHGNTVDTNLGENGSEGWWFNRDLITLTPYSFVNTNPSIGSGSIYVPPIGANASDKFIAELFVFDYMGEVESFSYDFKIGPNGVSTQEEQFYLNVYANFNVSGPTKFYDCRYNIVPVVGSTGSYTTVVFNPDVPVSSPSSVATRTGASASPYPCPATPSDMGADAYIRVFAVNLGDTASGDVGLDGYFDKAVYRTTSAQTTYDFEPYPRTAAITAPTNSSIPKGVVDFGAYLNDDDVDNTQWAIRQGTCAAGTGTVFGNVDGHDDVATINQAVLSNQTFQFSANMASMATGLYCFVYNPVEDSGESDIRLTHEFSLVDTATVIAAKIICNDEESLPNDGYTSIGPNTAQEFVSQNEGCVLANNWDYQYRLSGSSSPEPVGYGVLDGWETFTNTKHIPLSGNTTIQMREVLPEGYIPFTGQHSQDSVSAEFYCNNDAGNYDNWEWISNPQAGATYYCVAWNVPIEPTFNVHAAKVVCDSEQYLPNYGLGGPDMTVSTAQTHVDESDGHCWLADWKFQWSPDGVGNPGDNLGEQAGAWTTFDDGSITLPVSSVGNGDRVWLREVMNDNYIPFSGTPGNNPYSAEFYCNNDVLNYDNWDWIQNPQANADYYCVGFNVLKPAVLSATKIVCDTEGVLPNWGNHQATTQITSSTADDWLTQGQNAQHCHKEPWQFQWVSDAQDSSNPGNNNESVGAPWQAFNSTVNIDTATLGENKKIWVREVPDADYIPFTGQNTNEDVSAEIYCNGDVLHYDNWEYINVESGKTYHCVAWNVHIDAASIQGRKYHDKNANGNFDNPEKNEAGNPNRLDGWSITLEKFIDASWVQVDQMETGSDSTPAGNMGKGQYKFVGLGVGTYRVCEENRDGWVQTEPSSGEIDAETGLYCFTVEISNPTQEVDSLQFGNYEAVGQIQGLIYNDEDGDGDQGPEEEPLEGWDAWLLTHNSPYTLRAVQATAFDGTFVFEDLAYGTYYVCQDLQLGWTQTELEAIGIGIDLLSAIDVPIEDPDNLLHDFIDEFCYTVVLDPETPVSLPRIFGNFQNQEENPEQPSKPQVLADVDDKTGGQGEGDVLADSDTLSDTGNPAITSVIVGAILAISAGALLYFSRKKSYKA